MVVRNDTLFAENDAIFLFKINGVQSKLKPLKQPLQFSRVISKNLRLNLQMVDSKLPEILAYALYYSIKARVSTWLDIISVLDKINPLKINNTSSAFYKIKITQFLIEIALGLSSTQIYQGISNDLFFVHVNNEETVQYHQTYDRKLLVNFLLNRTKLSNIINFDDLIYKENGIYYIKFNLRIKIIPSIP